MSRHPIRLALAVSGLALLAACGGETTTVTTERVVTPAPAYTPPTVYAPPAAYVPPATVTTTTRTQRTQ